MQDVPELELDGLLVGARLSWGTSQTSTMVEYIERMVAEIKRRRAPSTAGADGTIEALLGRINILSPRSEDIRAGDIARGIATKYRYAGHTSELYTVAEHSVIVSFCVPPQHARRALLHDGSEGYTCDMPRPIKNLPELAGFREVEDRLQAVIFRRFDIDPDDAEGTDAVHEADLRICVDEIEQVQPRAGCYVEQLERLGQDGYGHALLCLEPRDAERAWLARFRELFPRSMWS